MKITLNALFMVAALLMGSASYAEEHPVGTIKGNNIDLKTYDHAIAGQIKNFVMWGFVDEAKGTSELIMRRDEQIVQTTFGKQADGKFGGVIRHTVDNKTVETAIVFVGVKKELQQLILSINGQEVAVTIQGKLDEAGHFQNPTYSTVLNGEAVSYTMEGAACYGFSFHIAAIILGAYSH